MIVVEPILVAVRRRSGVAHLPDCEWLPLAIRDPEQFEREHPDRDDQARARERALGAYELREVVRPIRLRLCPTCVRRGL